MTEFISQSIDVALLSRLYDDEKYVDKIVGSFTELANMYNIVTANCNKNAETFNRNVQLTEKAICSNDEAYASEEIQGNRATTHTANHESLATIYIHDISLVLDKENVSK